jgi:O-antigen ligase
MTSVIFPGILLLLFVRPFITAFAFRTLDLWYSLVFLLCVAAFLARNRNRLRAQPLNYPLILYCIALAVSLFYSNNPTKSISLIHTYFFGVASALVAIAASKDEKRYLVHTILAASALAAFVSTFLWRFGPALIMRYLALNKINDPFAVEYFSRDRAFLPFILPTALSGYIIMHLCIALGYFENNYKKLTKSMRLWAAAMIIIMVGSVLISKSFGPLASIVAAFAIVFLYEKRLRKGYLVALVIFLILLAIIFIIRLSHATPTSSLPFSWERRLSYWLDAGKTIKEHSLWGVGPGNFTARHSHFAHNFLLQAWSETGILGIAGLAWIIMTVLKAIPGKLKNPLGRSFCAAWLFFILHNLMDITFYLPEIASSWWILTGILVSREERS